MESKSVAMASSKVEDIRSMESKSLAVESRNMEIKSVGFQSGLESPALVASTAALGLDEVDQRLAVQPDPSLSIQNGRSVHTLIYNILQYLQTNTNTIIQNPLYA